MASIGLCLWTLQFFSRTYFTHSPGLPNRDFARFSLPVPAPNPHSIAWEDSLPGALIEGRRLPEAVDLSELQGADLKFKAVSLPQANTLAHLRFAQGRLAQTTGSDGTRFSYNPEMVLLRFRDERHPAVLRVPAGEELKALEILRLRGDLAYAELDRLQVRQFIPNDPSAVSTQWHHQTLDSFGAWNLHLGSPAVKIAIVDTAFQMDHPDLAANVIPGWDAANNRSITSSEGYSDIFSHATLGAGLAAAVINNANQGAGMANCRILPIHINGFTSEMYNSVIWAASNGVRVVNLSWTGASESAMEDAGKFLEEEIEGILAMSGINGTTRLDYPDHPHVWAISMTDVADNLKSCYGPHIDFAAPGQDIYSTTTNGGFGTDSGTSFSTPVFSGSVALLISINPSLRASELIELLRTNAVDLGNSGRDESFGWGRIRLGAAAAAAEASLPRLALQQQANGQWVISTGYRTNQTYRLYQTANLQPPSWALHPTPPPYVIGGSIHFPLGSLSSTQSFFRVESRR